MTLQKSMTFIQARLRGHEYHLLLIVCTPSMHTSTAVSPYDSTRTRSAIGWGVRRSTHKLTLSYDSRGSGNKPREARLAYLWMRGVLRVHAYLTSGGSRPAPISYALHCLLIPNLIPSLPRGSGYSSNQNLPRTGSPISTRLKEPALYSVPPRAERVSNSSQTPPYTSTTILYLVTALYILSFVQYKVQVC